MTKTPYLKALFQSPNLFIAVLSVEGNLIDANAAALDFIDCELKDLKDDKFWETPWWEHSDQLQSKLKEGVEAAKRGEKTRFEANHFSPEGDKVNVDFVLRPVEVEEGTTRLLALGRDITDRKTIEKELKAANKKCKQSRERYRKYFEEVGDSVFILAMGRDDHGRILDANPTAAEQTGYSREELVGMNMIEDLSVGAPINMDYEEANKKLSRGETVNFTEKKKRKDGSEYWTDVVVTPIEHEEREANLSISRDITDRVEAKKKLKQSEEELRQSFIELAETTSKVIGVRDPYTQEHEQRVAKLAENVGERMGLNEDKQLGLYLGGVLHDIGKIAIPETILTKPGELKDVEWKMIKSHPEVGYNQILDNTSFPWPVAEMTLHHHERLDGSGYPDGLEGDELSLEVRILSAVDVVEAMSKRRPYREARTKERTLKVIKDGKGDKFEPEVVEVLVDIIEEGAIEFRTEK